MVDDDDLQLRAQGRIGTVLCGKYRIDHVLGVGGMAVVYAATHRNQKRVALKMLHPELSMHKEVRARFMREGYAANTVDHPGAVAVIDDDVAEDGAAFLVMERLEGDEVERIWQRHGGRLDARVVLAIADPLLAVLQAAHAKSIVHRDIKPANLFITHDGTLKVLDFGIARARDAASEGNTGTKTGMLLGTPAYMAPEQALAKSKEIDGPTDLWSVGATLYALLSGHLVHDAESSTAVLVQAATQPARSLALVAPDVDPRVVAVVDRALVFDKAGRWPSAAAMRTAVRDVYEAMFGAKVSKEPLEHLLAEPLGSAPTVVAPSVPPSASTPVHDGGAPRTPAPAPIALPDPNARTSYPDAVQPAMPFPQTTGASPRVYVGPEGLRGSSPAVATTARPVASGAEAAAPPKKASLLLPVLLGVIALVACAGMGVVAWRRTSPAPVVPAAIPSAPEPLSAAPPQPDAADASDMDAAATPAVTVSVSASSAAPPNPAPTQTVYRPPQPAWTLAPAPIAPAPTPLFVPPPAPAPPPPPAAPPPVCRAQCVDVARVCKSQCKGDHRFGRDRHQCLVSCEATERECRSHAPC